MEFKMQYNQVTRSLSRTALSFALTFFIAPTLVLAANEGGGGHNGPDLNGPSIPVEVDRLLTKAEIGRAINRCAQGTLAEVAEQVLRAQPRVNEQTQFSPFQLSDSPMSGNGPTVEGSFFGTYVLTVPNDKTAESMYYWDVQSLGQVSGANSRADLVITARSTMIKGVGEVVMQLSSENFPFVRFDAAYPDSVIDELGNVDHEKVKVSKIRIYLPMDLRTDEPLYNVRTQRKTAITVNLKRYVDCIKSSIQN